MGRVYSWPYPKEKNKGRRHCPQCRHPGVAAKPPVGAGRGAAKQSLKQAAQNEKAVADLVEQATDDLAATTPTRGNVVNIKA